MGNALGVIIAAFLVALILGFFVIGPLIGWIWLFLSM